MTEIFESLIARIHAQDPNLTPVELEKIIAHCIGERVNELFEEIMTSPDTASLCQAIQEKFGLSCKIAPEMSLYVNIDKEQDQQQSDVVPFSSRLLDEAIDMIREKDFSAIPPQEILQLICNVINNSTHHFLQTIVLSNHRFRELMTRFTKTYDLEVAMVPRAPVTIYANRPQSPATSDTPEQTFGNYL